MLKFVWCSLESSSSLIVELIMVESIQSAVELFTAIVVIIVKEFNPEYFESHPVNSFQVPELPRGCLNQPITNDPKHSVLWIH